MTSLRVDAGLARMIRACISSAFNETNSGNARNPEEILQGEDKRPFHKTVNEEFMCLWIDLRDASVMPLKVEGRRSDDAVKILKRGAARSGGGRRRCAEIAR
jgi:hypothetical protein